jgi:hypothetical protein
MRHRDEFGELLESRGYTIAVEVGVQEGKFSDIVLSKWSGTLYMVDRWCHAEGYKDISNVSDDQHSACMAAAFEVSVRHGGRGYLLKETSAEAAERFDDAAVDAVYLDADHSKAGVLADLKLWMPKVRPGGVIAGHDYLDGDLPEGDFGVRSAVLEFFGREPEMVTGEQWPSWLIEVTA